MKKIKGKLIAIEGIDGTGKTTQIKKLIARLKKEGHKTEVFKFPQYNKISGALAQNYLRGDYGDAYEVGAKAATILYAVDRFAAKKEIEKALEEGRVVILDRYMQSNMAYQGSKLKTKAQRIAFWEWEQDLEYNILGVPRPDKVIFLHLPPEVSHKLMIERNEGSTETRLKEKNIHEDNKELLEKSEQTYRELAQRSTAWRTVKCAGEKTPIRTRKEIHGDVWGIIEEVIGK